MSLLEKEKVNLETIESLKSKGFETSKTVCSESENQSENDCHVVEKECDKEENPNVIAPGMFKLNASQMNGLLDDHNFFIFNDVNVRISHVSKIPFRKKPRDSMHVHSKSNSNKYIPRTVHKWLPKLQSLAEPVAKWFSRIVQICLWIIDSGCSKHMTGNRALLTNFVEKFLGTVRFSNNDFAVIAGYGDVVIGFVSKQYPDHVYALDKALYGLKQAPRAWYNVLLQFLIESSFQK
nr:reverse transcriptase [Tanacetum cinerariifolium]